jgi:hypothetical protein
MTINDLASLARARLVHLSQLLSSYTALGDVAGMARTEAEIAQTQATLTALEAIG